MSRKKTANFNKLTLDEKLAFVKRHPELQRPVKWQDVAADRSRQHYSKEYDYSSRGVKTPYFSSNGWRSREKNTDGIVAWFQASANRSHERSMASSARAFKEQDNRKHRRHLLRMKWGPLAKFIERDW